MNTSPGRLDTVTAVEPLSLSFLKEGAAPLEGNFESRWRPGKSPLDQEGNRREWPFVASW